MKKEKLNDIIKNDEEYINFIQEKIKYITNNLPKRTPGSNGENEAASYLADLLNNECGCKDVIQETYKFHPIAFYGWIYITMTFDILGMVLLFFNPLIALICLLTSIVIKILEFVFYKEVIDFMFKTKKGSNVTTLKKGKNAKRRIYFNGHIDAAWEWPVNYHFGGIIFKIMAIIPTIGALYTIILSIIMIFNQANGFNGQYKFYALFSLIFLPFYYYMYFLINPKKTVDGALDNLTGSLLSIALIKALNDKNIDLSSTDVGIILTGGEEAGLRGAKAWGKKHKSENKKIATYIITLDTLYNSKDLMINVKDLNGIVKSDSYLLNVILRAAEETSVKIKKGKMPLLCGSTDSAAFTKAGFHSISVTGISHKLEKVYHTRLDTYERLDYDVLSKCFKMCIKIIELFDSENDIFK